MTTFSKLNYVNVGPHGTFMPSGNLSTTPADIDAIFNHLKRTDTKKLAIHFHGGLIDEGAGLDIARKMVSVYDHAGSHPVTFIWETGLVETISRNLTKLHKTTLFNKIIEYALRHVGKNIGGDIGGKGPGDAMGISDIEQELKREDAFDRFDDGARGGAAALDQEQLEIVRGEIEVDLTRELEADDELSELIQTGMAETEYLKPGVLGADESAKGLVEVATLAKKIAVVTYKVLQRYLKKTEHGLYPTVVEEVLHELYLADLGSWVWDGMKDVACNMWQPNSTSVDESSHSGTYFLNKLLTYMKEHSGFTVDLIGHSAGSIAICEMFKAVAKAGMTLKVRNVLFLAPACRSDLFHEEVVKHPERFEAFKMFTMEDALEQNDRLVPGIYTRSLLYFISGVLEKKSDVPIAGLARHFSGQPPYNSGHLLEINKWLNVPGRLVRSKTGASSKPGYRSDATSHGDFDDDSLTRESITAILSVS